MPLPGDGAVRSRTMLALGPTLNWREADAAPPARRANWMQCARSTDSEATSESLVPNPIDPARTAQRGSSCPFLAASSSLRSSAMRLGRCSRATAQYYATVHRVEPNESAHRPGRTPSLLPAPASAARTGASLASAEPDPTGTTTASAGGARCGWERVDGTRDPRSISPTRSVSRETPGPASTSCFT